MATAFANPLDGAGRLSKASPANVRSRLAAPDANGKGRRHSAFSRGHHVHVVSNQPKKGISNDPILSKVLTLSRALTNWRRFRLASFSHSHRLPVLPRSSRSGSVRSLAQTRTYSARSNGCTRSPRQSLGHQQFINAVADGSHLNRLSSSAVSVGIDPNENGLTHAQASFAPGANSND